MLSRLEILQLIKNLASSQGFYSELWNTLEFLRTFEPSAFEEVMQEWESKNFQTCLDFILFLEEDNNEENK